MATYNVLNKDCDQTALMWCTCGEVGSASFDLWHVMSAVCHNLFAAPLCVIGRLCSVSVALRLCSVSVALPEHIIY